MRRILLDLKTFRSKVRRKDSDGKGLKGLAAQGKKPADQYILIKFGMKNEK